MVGILYRVLVPSIAVSRRNAQDALEPSTLVFSIRHYFKVIGVDASPDTAKVVDPQMLRDRFLKVLFVHHSMYETFTPVNTDLAVSLANPVVG